MKKIIIPLLAFFFTLSVGAQKVSQPTGIVNGHGYVDLGLPSGTKWATCNVGANKPEENGFYFAWGETKPKSKYDWSTYKYCQGKERTLTKYCNNFGAGKNVDNKKELELSDDAAYINWGEGWRMPNYWQMGELLEECQWSLGEHGYIGIGPNGNSILLPAARNTTEDAKGFAGGLGCYWTRSLKGGDEEAYCLYFYSTIVFECLENVRCDGFSVRPIYLKQ